MHEFLDMLYPLSCLGCRRRGRSLCDSCEPTAAESICESRAGLRVVSVGAYEGAWRRAILGLKRGRRDACGALAESLVRSLDEHGVGRDTLVVPVPTTLAQARERGFDQGVGLALEVARLSGRPVLAALAKRRTSGQRGRSREQRLRAAGNFHVLVPALVAHADVVLVDDVVTTGATLADCAGALAACDARVRGAFVLALA